MGFRGAVLGVVALGLLAGGAWVADELARGNAETVAEGAVARQVQSMDGPFAVRIGGFPFLTQYLAGTLDDVRLTATSVTLEGVTVTDVTADLADVSTASPYRVRDLRVEATVPTATLAALVRDRTSLDVGVEGDALSATGEVLGLPLTAVLVPRVEGGDVVVDVQEVRLGPATVDVDRLPAALADRLAGLRVPIEGLPPQVALTDARVVPEGVRFTASGTDVLLEELG